MNTVRYQDVLLDALPWPCARALDVGCGLGDFARRLAPFAGQVDAIDRVPEVIARARVHSRNPSNVRFACADAMTTDLEPGYDFVCALASQHHLPLESALARLAGLLRLGGVLGVIGLYRPVTVFDHMAFAAAYPFGVLHRIIRRGRDIADRVPLCDPVASLDDIHSAAAVALPGAVIRRRLMWRYTLVYRS